MCFYYGDCEPSRVWRRDVVQRARKKHRCDDCLEVIPVHSTYESVRWLNSEGWTSLAICARCHFVRHLIHQAERAGGCAEYEAWAPYPDLWTWWSEGAYAERLGLAIVEGELWVNRTFPGALDRQRPVLNEVPRW